MSSFCFYSTTTNIIFTPLVYISFSGSLFGTLISVLLCLDAQYLVLLPLRYWIARIESLSLPIWLVMHTLSAAATTGGISRKKVEGTSSWAISLNLSKAGKSASMFTVRLSCHEPLVACSFSNSYLPLTRNPQHSQMPRLP